MKTDDMKRDAVLSADGKFRYSLTRSWAAEGAPLLPMCFVMHNPSTADAAVDDPTIRKCIGFAQRANCRERLASLPYPKTLEAA